MLFYDVTRLRFEWVQRKRFGANMFLHECVSDAYASSDKTDAPDLSRAINSIMIMFVVEVVMLVRHK